MVAPIAGRSDCTVACNHRARDCSGVTDGRLRGKSSRVTASPVTYPAPAPRSVAGYEAGWFQRTGPAEEGKKEKATHPRFGPDHTLAAHAQRLERGTARGRRRRVRRGRRGLRG